MRCDGSMAVPSRLHWCMDFGQLVDRSPRPHGTLWTNPLCHPHVPLRKGVTSLFIHSAATTEHNKWPPLWFRLGISSALQHLGGIHSGCASSAVMWLIFKVTLVFKDHLTLHGAVLAMGVLTNLAVGCAMLSALPWVRNNHHKCVLVAWLGVITHEIVVCSSANIAYSDGTFIS